MAVMQVGVMRVPMHQGQVPVPMRVRLDRRDVGAAAMLVMRIVRVPVLVLHRFVNMLMSLGQVAAATRLPHRCASGRP
jgi:hypothetical protein